MQKIDFTKPALTISQQISQLTSRGLTIKNVSIANKKLSELEKAIAEGKVREELYDYLCNLFDEDKLTDEEYDELVDWLWNNTNDSTYTSVKKEYLLVAEFIYPDDLNSVHYTVYDVSNDEAHRLALLDEINKSLMEIATPGDQPWNAFIRSCIKDFRDDVPGGDTAKVVYHI